MLWSYPTLKIPPELLREQVESIHGYADLYSEIIDWLNNVTVEMKESGYWSGLAYDELVRVNSLNTEHYAPYVQTLHDLADFLEEVADKMEGADTEIKTKIQAIS